MGGKLVEFHQKLVDKLVDFHPKLVEKLVETAPGKLVEFSHVWLLPRNTGPPPDLSAVLIMDQ